MDNLINLFARTKQLRSQKETHCNLQFQWVLPSIECPTLEDINSHLNSFPDRDSVRVMISIAGGDGIYFTSGNKVTRQDSLVALSSQIANSEIDDEIIIAIDIDKKQKNSEISIYYFDLFIEHLSNINIKDQLSIFDDFLKASPILIITCQTLSRSFKTKSILFRSSTDTEFHESSIDRNKKLAQRSDITHFSSGINYALCPDDFHVVEGDPMAMEPIFENLKRILSFCFIVNQTSIADNSIGYKLNGYRTVVGEIKFSEIPIVEWSSIYEAYDWAYLGGEISDKIGLLRNIATIYLTSKGAPKFDSETIRSVKSGFEIYLRKNIEQYIEVKNQVATFLCDLRKSMRDDAKQYAGTLTQTLGAFLTFFLTTFIINTVSGGKIRDIFTRDIVYITYAFLCCSIFYLFISLCTFLKQRRALRQDFNMLKKQYTDLLDSADLEKIFDNDTSLGSVLKEAKNSAIAVTIVWLIMVAIIGITISVLRVPDAAKQGTESVHQTPTATVDQNNITQ